MRITAVYTHPLKGAHRIEHESAAVEPWGLAGDRRWMVVDDDGVGITQRDDPRLALLRVRPEAGGLTLSAPHRPDLFAPEPADGPEELVRVFRHHDKVPARIADSGWISAYLGRPARLVWQADPTGRAVPGASRPGDPVSLADGYPVLLASTASLDAVNDWLAEAGEQPVPITRFRPNLVVSGAPAWAEDDWLGRHRRYAEGLLFAINLIPDQPRGVIHVGDPVVLDLS